MPRVPIPFSVIDKKKNFMTKGEIEAREKNEPKIKSDKMTPPKSLSYDAKKEWKAIIKLYKELDIPIFNDLDKNALEVYCEYMALFKNTKKEFEDEGGKAVDYNLKNKKLDVMKECAMMCHKYGNILLLDPTSRARMGVIAEKKHNDKKLKNDMDELLDNL